MLGLGKVFGSIFGGFFESIGLGWMSNILSLTVNVMSGNWLAAAKDVLDLVARFSNNEWMDRVASLPPLGEFDFGAGGCFGQNSVLTDSTLNSWLRATGSNDRGGLNNFLRAVYIARETLENNAIARANYQYAVSTRVI